MIWSIALAILGGARRIFSAVVGLAVKYPWQCALALMCVATWWQWDGRQDALKERDRYKAALVAEKTVHKADIAKWNRQVAEAKAATARAIAAGKEVARDAQATHDRLAEDNAGLRSYIAANRLPSRRRTDAPAGTGGDNDPAVPAEGTAETLVAVRESDLAICDDLYAYAFGAYEFTVDLRRRELATPEFGTQ